MRPLLDPDTGVPLEGQVERRDSDGYAVQCRLWRGYYVVDFTGIESRLENLLANFQPRHDDVLIWAYVKCGTHWLNEISHFLLTRQCVDRPVNKEKLMLEFVGLPVLESAAPPRVLNSHLPLPLLPKQILQPNCSTKIIVPLRNPKDVAVSLYHHYTRIGDYRYTGAFPAFLAGLFEPGTVDGGSYFEHTELLLEALSTRQLPADRIHLVEYEKLKSNTAEEIRRLDKFLMSDCSDRLSDELLSGICQSVDFAEMRQARGSDMGHLFEDGSGCGSGFYRKGDVGDWRNYFNETDSQRIDKLVEKHLKRFEHIYRPTYEI